MNQKARPNCYNIIIYCLPRIKHEHVRSRRNSYTNVIDIDIEHQTPLGARNAALAAPVGTLLSRNWLLKYSKTEYVFAYARDVFDEMCRGKYRMRSTQVVNYAQTPLWYRCDRDACKNTSVWKKRKKKNPKKMSVTAESANTNSWRNNKI